MPWYEIAGWCAAAAVASSLLTLSSIHYARRRGLLDLAGERRSHVGATPRGGGIAIVLVCLAWLLAAARSGEPREWLLAAGGLALVAGVGWWDDHRPLPAWPRLLAHVLAGTALAAAAHGWGAGAGIVALVLVGVPVVVNAWNFMDGIDTLATGQALLCAVAVAVAGGADALPLAVVLAGACAGFLPFNRPRARIFLGDVGSGALGYLLVVLGLLAMRGLPASHWPLLLLPPMAMLLDAAATLASRVLRGERWWTPHVEHAYQGLARRWGHGRTSLAYAGWTAALIGFMLWAQRDAAARSLAVVVGAIAATALGWWLGRRLPEQRS